MDKRRKTGDFGEKYACKMLKKAGFRIVKRNYTLTCGEIDIIAENNDLIVFVEVKTRTEGYLYRPVYAVTPEKQRKIKNTATVYLKSEMPEKQPRFDVIEIILDAEKKRKIKEYVHIENAF